MCKYLITVALPIVCIVRKCQCQFDNSTKIASPVQTTSETGIISYIVFVRFVMHL